MKKIEVIIPKGDVDAVARALAVEGVSGMTISEVKGWGVRQSKVDEKAEARPVQVSPKLKVEMVVLANEAEAVMDRLTEALKAGCLGPAKMFSSSVDGIVHTRSGARDHQALAWRFVAGN
jgi:nitrogen regulatory protein P-II 1